VTEAELIQLIAREIVAALANERVGECANIADSPVRGFADSRGGRMANDIIPIGVSVRHVHLCRADLDVLFGPGHELQARNELYQPGAYAAQETVTLVTPKRVLQNVRILFPLRKQTQVELAYSDAVYLGLNPPIVLSGRRLKGSAGVVIVGPEGAVDLKEGVIIAARHVHASPSDVARWGVRDRDEIDVAIDGPRAMTLRRVVVRVHENSRLELHLDTDEANAACITCGVTARFVGLTN
jgi:propanediol utilization protein